MVTLLTTEFNIQNFQHGAHIAFMCFALISDQTANFSLSNINTLVFVQPICTVFTARYGLSPHIKMDTFSL